MSRSLGCDVAIDQRAPEVKGDGLEATYHLAARSITRASQASHGYVNVIDAAVTEASQASRRASRGVQQRGVGVTEASQASHRASRGVQRRGVGVTEASQASRGASRAASPSPKGDVLEQ